VEKASLMRHAYWNWDDILRRYKFNLDSPCMVSLRYLSTFTHYNKLTSRIVSKSLMGLITLNQVLIHTLTPNLMGVI